jgi:hypothetical protein
VTKYANHESVISYRIMAAGGRAVEPVRAEALADEEEAEVVVLKDVAGSGEEVAVEVDMKPTVAEEAPVLLQAQSPTGTTLRRIRVLSPETCRSYLKSKYSRHCEVSALRLLHRHLHNH